MRQFVGKRGKGEKVGEGKSKKQSKGSEGIKAQRNMMRNIAHYGLWSELK